MDESKIKIITTRGEASCDLCDNPSNPTASWNNKSNICLDCLEHLGFMLHHHEEKEEVEY
jgi:hypothetical protein